MHIAIKLRILSVLGRLLGQFWLVLRSAPCINKYLPTCGGIFRRVQFGSIAADQIAEKVRREDGAGCTSKEGILHNGGRHIRNQISIAQNPELGKITHKKIIIFSDNTHWRIIKMCTSYTIVSNDRR